MIPKHSHLSLLVYFTCLGLVSAPVRVLSQASPLSSPPGVSPVSEAVVSPRPPNAPGSLAQLPAANPAPPKPANPTSVSPAPLNLPPINSGPVTPASLNKPPKPTPANPAPAQLPSGQPVPGQAAPANSPETPQPSSSRIWFFGLLSLAVGSLLGGSVFYLTRRPSQLPATARTNVKAAPSPKVLRPSPAKSFPEPPLKLSSQPLTVEHQQNGHHTSFAAEIPSSANHDSSPDAGHSKTERLHSGTKTGSVLQGDTSGDDLDLAVGDASPISRQPEESYTRYQEPAIEETTRLAKVSIVDELIHDLQSPDRGKRSKAIWELGQRGDSQAVQPLVDLMIDSDSKQRSLILAALSEIGVRTLKPMNRALAISLQDDNPEVRKNAIRDLTRIYDMVSQISQLLRHATEDPDEEVQETARWALNQVGRIRTAAGLEGPTLPGAANAQDQLPGS